MVELGLGSQTIKAHQQAKTTPLLIPEERETVKEMEVAYALHHQRDGRGERREGKSSVSHAPMGEGQPPVRGGRRKRQLLTPPH